MAGGGAAYETGLTSLSPAQTWIVRRESAINLVANVMIGGVASVIAHGARGMVPVRGFSLFTLEFIPQTFMVTLVSTLIPAFIAARAVRGGKVAPLAAPRGRRLIPLALMLAAGMTVLLGGSVIALCVAVGPDAIAAPLVLAIKAAYGAIIALCVTPWAVRAGLSSFRPKAAAAAEAGLAPAIA